MAVPPKRPASAPVKRGRGRPPKSAMLAAAAHATAKDKSGATLMQASFINIKNPRMPREGSTEPTTVTTTEPDTPEDLDPNFLSALPEELRREVIEDHKRQRLQSAKLAISRKQTALVPNIPQDSPSQRPTTLKIPRPKKPTFTTQRLHEMSDLRTAIRDWFREFLVEGPFAEDTEALARYLGKVVGEERDMAKAVGVVKWLVWLVEDYGEEGGEGEKMDGRAWWQAVETVKLGVQRAVKDRGLGAVEF